MLWACFVLLGLMLALTACVGIVINRRNLIVMLLCVEMLFLAANMNFVLFSKIHNDVHGEIMTLFVIAIAAAESAIALALLVLMYRQYHSIDSRKLSNIGG